MEIKWSKSAIQQLDKALDYILEEGFATYAAEVEENILLRITNLADTPNIYPLDKYKKDNDGSYHAFEINEYRVSYRFINNQIKIFRIRHTSRRTLKY